MLTWYNLQEERSQPIAADRASEVEARLKMLEKKMHNQLADSEILLSKLRHKDSGEPARVKEEVHNNKEQSNEGM